MGDLPQEKLDIIKKFAEFVEQDKYQDLGEKKGFNGLNDYQSELSTVDGSLISSAQKLWKEKKNGNKPIAAVFVADVSGSMNGEPLNRLKQSLLTGQKYLGKDNSIGFVSTLITLQSIFRLENMTRTSSPCLLVRLTASSKWGDGYF